MYSPRQPSSSSSSPYAVIRIYLPPRRSYHTPFHITSTLLGSHRRIMQCLNHYILLDPGARINGISRRSVVVVAVVTSVTLAPLQLRAVSLDHRSKSTLSAQVIARHASRGSRLSRVSYPEQGRQPIYTCRLVPSVRSRSGRGVRRHHPSSSDSFILLFLLPPPSPSSASVSHPSTTRLVAGSSPLRLLFSPPLPLYSTDYGLRNAGRTSQTHFPSSNNQLVCSGSA
jgi:hypothetical protein